ncbi:nuclear transport factor 2 family protein [Specibacter sp. RAF43]|uniref:nuclear transport factor 2 family protein n=1 Tax=Specibacter sp. RAF43 TaxID=3233057 RepID=UPI003F9C03B5
MSTEETREIVLTFTAARAENDSKAIRALLHDDVQWHPPVSIRNRPHVGADRVTRALTGGSTSSILEVASIQRQTHQMIVEGDAAVVRQVMTAQLLAGGEYRNDYCWIYECSNGQITKLIEYGDTLVTARAGFIPLETPTPE